MSLLSFFFPVYRHSRLEEMDRYVQERLEQYGKNARMNVELTRCK
ncbi:hypothetical protein [Rodentibacter abscessus]